MNQLLIQLDHLTQKTKENLQATKRVALDKAWRILQETTAEIVRQIELDCVNMTGRAKKELAMSLIEKFYDSVFTIIDIPVIPQFLESFIHKYIKIILMILISSTIDALVTTFRSIGIFSKPLVPSET